VEAQQDPASDAAQLRPLADTSSEPAWQPFIPEHIEECVAGSAGGYPCNRVDLLEVMPTSTIGGGNGNDLWGWTDPLDGREYALMGRTTGTAFIDITDSENPIYLGNLPTSTGNSIWRDIKTYADHAFIVSDSNGNHGMQVFDLAELRSVVSPPVTFSETGHYSNFGSAHNIVINEDSGYAFAVGVSSGATTCSGGLHMIDISTPDTPTFAGCFSSDGYTHDAQCVTYSGPDPDHQGSEICFNSNTDTLTIVDVTNKNAPVQLSRTGYAGSAYTHQGWLTEDQMYFLVNDEIDEISFGHNTRTYIWDVQDLDSPTLIDFYESANTATDHNLYVHNGLVYQANYRSGLRILSLDDVAAGNLTELGFFDTYPPNDNVGTANAWSVYPFFDSGNVIISVIDVGLFVVRPELCDTPPPPTALSATPNGNNSIQLNWSSSAPLDATFDVYRSIGACPGDQFQRIASGVTATSYQDDGVSGQVAYSYQVRASVVDGLCVSTFSACSSATTTGTCTAPPSFAGLEAVTNPAGETCALDLDWSAASPNCGASVDYSIYRSASSGFDPLPANRIANGVTTLSYRDLDVTSGQDYYYVTRSTDSGSGSEDTNRVERAGRPTGPITSGAWGTGAEIGDPGTVLGSGFRAPAHIGWEIVTNRQNTGDRSFFSTYANDQCTWIATPPLQLTPGGSSELSFWTLYDIESRWDGGVVQFTTDGGMNWTILALDQGYPGTFQATDDACGFNEGDPSFTGTNLTWSEYTADLSGLAGEEIQVRWIFSTDGFQTQEGWYLDDIAVTDVGVPGKCSANPVLFADGFESGDSSAWSATQP
jgi:choice-of-anchor B domain-containing protein